MKVLELLNSPHKWCKNALARNKDGAGVSYKSAEATAYCLTGAVSLCYPDDTNATLMKLGKVCKKLFASPSLTTFNNEATWEQVAILLKEADL